MKCRVDKLQNVIQGTHEATLGMWDMREYGCSEKEALELLKARVERKCKDGLAAIAEEQTRLKGESK